MSDLLRTTIAGSLPRPVWLAEPEALKGAWKLSGEELEDGKRRAATEWIAHQEEANIDILTDGEVFRTHFVHAFLEGIDGIDQDKKTLMGIRDNRYDLEVPTVTGPLSRPKSVHVDDFKFVRSLTDRTLKFTLPGPMTICDTIADAHYGSRPKMAMAFAELLNAEAPQGMVVRTNNIVVEIRKKPQATIRAARYFPAATTSRRTGARK